MVNVTVCIGSSCHLKGSRDIVEQLKALIQERHLEDKINLAGTFCMGNCMNGVSLTIDGEVFSLKPENTKTFFEKEIVVRL